MEGESGLMKAVIWTGYGEPEVLQLQEIEKPVPRPDEVLIRVRAATVTAGDCEARSLKFPLWLAIPMRLYVGVFKPTRTTILGQELAGEVVAVGDEVSRFRVGDQVFGSTGFAFGAYAEFKCMPEDSEDTVLSTIPANITYDEAAAVPTGGLEALHFLRKANIRPGERVLINGAGGSIGTCAIQLAKYYGAHVTAIDHADKIKLLRDLGADAVVDYTQEDFTRGNQMYDIILDVVGKASYSGCLRVLNQKGRYLIANPNIGTILRGLWTSLTSSKQIIANPAGREVADLEFLKALIEAETLRIHIDRRFALEQTAAAHRYVETGAKRGNVVIVID